MTMSRRAFRSVFTPTNSILALAVAAVFGATTVWAAGAAPSGGARPTLIVGMAPTSAPAVERIVAPTPAATAPAAARTPTPAPILPSPGITVAPVATAPAASAPAASAPGAATSVEVGAVTQPFVATITGDKVYVRSGPDTKYYEIGQLVKGDLVYVIGVNKGWYQILPPNGSFCMVAKEYVDLETGGTGGTIKGDFINVRAGSAIYKDTDPYAVVAPPLRKGTRLKVLGATDKYYQIAPPEKAYVFVSAQYVKAAAGTEYKVAQLKLPAGVTGPAGVTVVAPTTLPTAVPVITDTPPVGTAGGAFVGPGTGGTASGGTAIVGAAVAPVVPPKVTYSAVALTKFNETNTKYQAEAKKPLLEQSVDGVLQDFKDVLAMENIAPSVKAGAQANIAAIERTLTVQKLSREQNRSAESLKVQSDALLAQFAAVEKAKAEALAAGPYAAEGLLKTSTVVAGMYALVNPDDQRVVAYVDPTAASIDVGMFVGKYIGVRGSSRKLDGADITVIKVDNATMMPLPKSK
jgi:uncharacterized protein YgiM (DUF1202 family)